MCGYFCIGFIDFIWKGKSLLEYTNIFSHAYEKNDKIISKDFQYNLTNLICIVMFVINIQNLKKRKYYLALKNIKSVYCLQKVRHEYKKIFKEEVSIETLKIPGLVKNIEEYQKI